MAWDWTNIIQGIGAAGDLWSTYKGAEFARDNNLTPQQQFELYKQMQPNFINELGSSTFDPETNTRTGEMSPAVRALVNTGLGLMFNTNGYQVSNGLLGPGGLNEASINEYRGYYGQDPVTQNERPQGGTGGINEDYLLGEPEGGGVGTANSVGSNSSPESRSGGVYNPNGSRDMPGYPFHGGHSLGGGINVGYGGLGGLPYGGNGGGSGSWMPDWLAGQQQGSMGQLEFGDFVGENGGLIGSLLGSALGIPGGKWLGDYFGDAYQNNMYNNYRFDNPVDPRIGETDIMGELNRNLDNRWQDDALRNSNQGVQGPNLSNTGRSRVAIPGDSTSGGMNAYNRTVYQRNPNQSGPVGEGFWEAAEIQDPNPWIRRR